MIDRLHDLKDVDYFAHGRHAGITKRLGDARGLAQVAVEGLSVALPQLKCYQ